MNRTARILFALALLLSLTTVGLAACSATAGVRAFQEEAAEGGPQRVLQAVGDSTGNPLIIAAVGVVNGLLTAWGVASAKKHAVKVANDPLTTAQVQQVKGA